MPIIKMVKFIDKYYVGSRTRLLEDRLNEHQNEKKSAVYKYRNDKPKIKLICNCQCKDKKNAGKD